MFVLTGFRRIAVMALWVALAVAFTGTALGASLTPGSKALQTESCVAPRDAMRRNHMDYLHHDRDRAVHQGVHDVGYSIAGCVDCHAGRDASGTAVPVNAEGQFCAGCHQYTGVSISCFQCHRKVPEGK